jgi:hypothetical protein
MAFVHKEFVLPGQTTTFLPVCVNEDYERERETETVRNVFTTTMLQPKQLLTDSF